MKAPPVQMSLLNDLAEVDTILSRAIAAGDPLIAVEYGNNLHRTAFLKGVSLAKLLYGLRDNWELFRAAGIGESFEDFVEAHFINLDRSTATRYANMYRNIFENPDLPAWLKEQLKFKPIHQLLMLSAGVGEGSIGEEELQDAILKNDQGIREIVKKARGEQTKSKTAIYAKIIMREDSRLGPKGTLVVFQDGWSENLGIVNLNPHKEFTKQFLERMKNRLQIGELL